MAMTVKGDTLSQRLTNPQTRIRVAQNFTMEWSMLWKDLAIGFLVGGFCRPSCRMSFGKRSS